MSSAKFSYDPNTAIPSLQGKVILITGANSGLGKQAALELAKHNPHEIWMASRSVSKGQTAIHDIHTHVPTVALKLLKVDLSSFSSIQTAATTFLSSTSRLDILLLNAGILGHPPALTTDGHEIHMGTNHLGHALFLSLLAPLLTQTSTLLASSPANVRVVITTSIGYKTGSDPTGISFSLLKQAEGLPAIERYIQSRLANLLYARAVARHFPKFTTVAVHPGEAATALFLREPGDEQVAWLCRDVAPTKWYGVEEGVKNLLWAATAVEGVRSGEYYEPVGVGGRATGWAVDEGLEAKVWEWTERELRDHLGGG